MPNAYALVMSADDGYAMQLAVAVKSFLTCLGPDEQLKLYVIDGGLSSISKSRCENSWDGPLAELVWIRPPKKKFSRLRASDHYSIATYYRLILADLLPEDLSRVVYSDPDVLCFESIGSIFNLQLNDNILAAVQDPYCPYIDNRIGLPDYDNVKEFVFGLAAVPNLNGQPVNPRQQYFNAGFFLADLEKLRQEGLSKSMLTYCIEHRHELLWADQCALNACLGARWHALDPAWNVIPHVFDTDERYLTIYDRSTIARIRITPSMVHFAGPRKPWNAGSSHPFTEAYFDAIDRTSWKGWRPKNELSAHPIDNLSPNSGWNRYRKWFSWSGKKVA